MTDRIEQIKERAEAYGNPHQGYRTERDVRYAEDTAYLLEHIEELEGQMERAREQIYSDGRLISRLHKQTEELEAENERLRHVEARWEVI